MGKRKAPASGPEVGLKAHSSSLREGKGRGSQELSRHRDASF